MPLSSFEKHIPDDNLDLYALGQLAEYENAIIEEHLLVCQSCCGRLSETERFITALRRAAIDLEPSAAPLRRPHAMSRTVLGRLRWGATLVPDIRV